MFVQFNPNCITPIYLCTGLPACILTDFLTLETHAHFIYSKQNINKNINQLIKTFNNLLIIKTIPKHLECFTFVHPFFSFDTSKLKQNLHPSRMYILLHLFSHLSALSLQSCPKQGNDTSCC